MKLTGFYFTTYWSNLFVQRFLGAVPPFLPPPAGLAADNTTALYVPGTGSQSLSYRYGTVRYRYVRVIHSSSHIILGRSSILAR
jgi:hypothetical protein